MPTMALLCLCATCLSLLALDSHCSYTSWNSAPAAGVAAWIPGCALWKEHVGGSQGPGRVSLDLFPVGSPVDRPLYLPQ